MTRLTTEMIQHIQESVSQWDEKLRSQTGMGFVELVARVSGQSETKIKDAASKTVVAAVPVTAGLGAISNFAQSVIATPSVMGFKTFVTDTADVDGLYEAKVRGADIVYMADEDRYIALNLNRGKIGENNYATASGYIELLSGAAGGIEGKEVLVLGFGIIGQEMCKSILRKKGIPVVYDKLKEKLYMAKSHKYDTIDTEEEIIQYQLIADGTNQGRWLKAGKINTDAVIAAPGIPLSVTEEAQRILGNSLIHDQLEIGTAVMLGLAL